MYRYPDGTYKAAPPAKVEYAGYIRSFADLTREQWDEIGYNEAVPLRREAYTTYETAWAKGEDLVYRETVVSAVVDEAARDAAQAETVRAERDGRLAECDWTQMSDTPLDDEARAAWATYRQALRDVPQQGGFPDAVEWPNKPE